MNTYITHFFCRCPINGVRIEYTLSIRTNSVIPVEEILGAVEKHTNGLHETIADEMSETFGGEQTLIANHHGVTIETERTK